MLPGGALFLFVPEVIDLHLAHVEENKTKAAYNHAEYMTERREMMQAWADWIDSIPERDTGSTLKLPEHEATSSPADPCDSDESDG